MAEGPNVADLTKQYEDISQGTSPGGELASDNLDPEKEAQKQEESFQENERNEDKCPGRELVSGNLNPEKASSKEKVSFQDKEGGEQEKNKDAQFPKITFKETNEAVLMRWTRIPDSENYKVHYSRDIEVYNKNSQDPEYELKFSTYNWCAGDTLTVTITSVDKKGQETEVCKDVEYVIGGDKAPSQLKVDVARDSSHNTIVLNWKVPKSSTRIYKITVRKYENDEFVRTVTAMSNNETIDNLNPVTSYYFIVKPIYQDGTVGKEVKSPSIKTMELSPELRDKPQITAHTDTTNPAREIIIKWKKPKTGFHKSEYKAYLCSGHDNKAIMATQQIIPPSDQYMEAKFKYLKSNTTYTACVEAIGQRTSKKFYSEPVTTNRANRSSYFDIKTAGKPIIKLGTEINNDVIKSVFNWELPDLKDEENNFKLSWIQAYMKEGAGDKEILTISEDKCSALPQELKFGKIYVFGVTCTYHDLDTDQPHDAKTTKALRTDIGKPAINSIDWEKKDIIVDWKPGNGSKSHTLKILDEAGKSAMNDISLTESKTKKKIEMTSACTYGRTCTFILEAYDNSKERRQKDERKQLIGGETAVTQVVMIKSVQNPRRSLKVEWKAPKKNPGEYKITLYELKANQNKEVEAKQFTTIVKKQLGHKFIELKSGTQYKCKISPVYKGDEYGGTLSNIQETEQKKPTATESDENFGLPVKLSHILKPIGPDIYSAELSWNAVDMGENYKILNFHIVVTPSTWFRKPVLETTLETCERKISIPHLKGQNTYIVKFTTLYRDLDTQVDSEKVKKYPFGTTSTATNINDCTWHNGIVRFSWLPVTGANKYELIIKNESLTEKIDGKVVEVTSESNECDATFQMADKLRIGKLCMTKVYTYTGDGLISETEWKAHLIGGDDVPRNVTAVRNAANPQRSVIVTFDNPRKEGAKKFKVKISPIDGGNEKTELFETNRYEIEYLRKGINYEFTIFAEHDGTWSEGSVSNSIKTEGVGAFKPIMKVSGLSHTTVDMTQANLQESVTNLNMIKGEEFGKVRDLSATVTPVGNDKDIMKLHWLIPSFSNNNLDYKVEKYKVTVIMKNGIASVVQDYLFEKGKSEYLTDDYTLKLGEVYEVSVSTEYLDIDQDHPYTSSAVKKDIRTRPCQPVVFSNRDRNDEVEIEWNAAKGAQKYFLDIYTGNSINAVISKNLENQTTWSRRFDSELGYGTSYYAEITAVGLEDKTNTFKTNKKTIGGDYVPRNLSATIDHPKITDRNTQAHLTWEPPKLVPVSYKLKSEPVVDELQCDYDGASCLVSGLKAGMYYTFILSAVHSKGGKQFTSGGCFSRKIQTNPTPTQVKNVHSIPARNPSSNVIIKWNKVDAEKEKETTKYRVCIEDADKSTKREINIEAESVEVHGLEPGKEYYVTVAGGNTLGYGINSEEHKFKTSFGTPKNVTLLHNENQMSSSAILKFTEADGKPKKYIAVLYKQDKQAHVEAVAPREVKSGHVYDDLNSSSNYFALIHAVFEGNNRGDNITSNELITAPSKPKFTKYGYSPNAGSKEIFAMWKSDERCAENEIKINCGLHGTLENFLTVYNKNEMSYFCQHESISYTLQVRSKNVIFGPWSDEVIVNLTPAKLLNVSAKLEEEGNDIVVQCDKAATDCPFYFMQATSDNQYSSDPIKGFAKEDNTNVIKFIFSPPMPSQKYTFHVWAENSDEAKGEITVTEKVLSRPSKSKVPTVSLNEINPSMDVEITWKAQERCNAYEVWICKENNEKAESQSITKETSLKYRCQSAGDKYLISVRSICDSVKGDWSDNTKICLTPSEIEFIEDNSQEPVKYVEVEWKKLEVKPECYIITLYEGQTIIMKKETNQAIYKFTEKGTTKPGALFHCTVAAKNGKQVGKATKSKYFRMAWSIPHFFEIKADNNNPSKCAKMKWGKPFGVNCFKLQIENNQSGIVSEITLKEDNYLFQSGIPGNTYTVRLFCGCDSRFDVNFITQPMIMKPEPPTDIKVIPNIDINGFLVEFKDISSLRKTYTVSAEPLGDSGFTDPIETQEHSVRMKNLVAGESYRIVVVAKLGEMISAKAFSDGFIKTIPGEITNLKSHKEDGCIVFEWDPLEIRPDNYKVQWRSCNERIIDEVTQETRFAINYPVPANIYSLRVMASNSAGSGIMSRWETFITDPTPPCNVQILPSVIKTNCIVKFDDIERNPMKKYKITARPYNGGEDITEITSDLCTVIKGPPEGFGHYFSVKTIFCGKESEEVQYTGAK